MPPPGMNVVAGHHVQTHPSPPTALRSSNDFRPEVPAGSSISRGVAPVVTATVSHGPRAAGEVPPNRVHGNNAEVSRFS